jgi:hypothetical protein
MDPPLTSALRFVRLELAPHMEPKGQQRNTQQHFVTAAYLVGFTPSASRDSHLWVYERNTEKIFRLIPDEAAKRRNYYSIPQKKGGFDDTVDTMLTGLEGQAMPSLQKLLARDYNLSTFERALLAYLIAFQEFRTPWARASFQKMEVSLTEQMMRVAAKAPGYLEQKLEELKANGEIDGSVPADKIRDALKNEKIKLVARPHAGIDTMVSLGQRIGDIYTQMRWTVLHAKEGEFLTSDAPVVRRDPGFREGLYGGGLMSPTAEVWFPLSKVSCLLIDHDEERKRKFFELLEAGKLEEAKAIRAELPPIRIGEVAAHFVQKVNHQTIANADRFVYSSFESKEISSLFKGECQNLRVVVG